MASSRPQGEGVVVADFTNVPGFGDVFSVDLGGITAAVVVPVVPQNASPEVREGIARRRLVMVEGVCPCGAVRPTLNREQRRAIKRGATTTEMRLRVEHEDDCPARDERLRELGLRWSA